MVWVFGGFGPFDCYLDQFDLFGQYHLVRLGLFDSWSCSFFQCEVEDGGFGNFGDFGDFGCFGDFEDFEDQADLEAFEDQEDLENFEDWEDLEDFDFEDLGEFGDFDCESLDFWEEFCEQVQQEEYVGWEREEQSSGLKQERQEVEVVGWEWKEEDVDQELEEGEVAGWEWKEGVWEEDCGEKVGQVGQKERGEGGQRLVEQVREVAWADSQAFSSQGNLLNCLRQRYFGAGACFESFCPHAYSAIWNQKAATK